jgi:hypothetical protein
LQIGDLKEVCYIFPSNDGRNQNFLVTYGYSLFSGYIYQENKPQEALGKKAFLLSFLTTHAARYIYLAACPEEHETQSPKNAG